MSSSIYHILNIGYLLFIIGVLGIVFNRKNIILMFIALEIILLSISIIFVSNGHIFDDIIGQIFALVTLTIAGGESAIGLAILVAFYRLRGDITFK